MEKIKTSIIIFLTIAGVILIILVNNQADTIENLDSQLANAKIYSDVQSAQIDEWKKQSKEQDKKIKHYEKLAEDRMRLDIPYVKDEIAPGCENAFRYGVLKAAELAE